MLVFCTLIYIFIFLAIVYKSDFFAMEGLSKKAILFLFLTKIVAGFLVLAIYKYYYASGDMFTFFDHSEKLFRLFKNNTPTFFNLITGGTEQLDYFLWETPFDNSSLSGSRTIVFINLIIRFFSFGFISVHVVFFAFFSFCGLFFIAKTFALKFPGKGKSITLLLVFFPPVLLWASSIQKETLVVLLIGLLLFYSRFLESVPKTVFQKTIFSFAFIALFFLKNYIALALFVLLFANVLSYFLKLKKQTIAIVLTLFLFFCASLFVQLVSQKNVLEKITERRSLAISEAKGGVFLYSNNYFISLDYYKKDQQLVLQPDSTFTIKQGSSYLQWNHNNMNDTTFVKSSSDTTTRFRFLYHIVPAKSAVAMKKIKPEYLALIKQIPEALALSLIYPIPGQLTKMVYAVPFFENIALFLLIIITIFYCDKSRINKKLLWNVLAYSLIVLVIIGLTNNVIGAVVRYKTAVWVVLLPTLIASWDTEKLKKQLRFFIQTKRN